MPKNHARKNQLAALKTQLGIKHADAIALLDHPDTDDRDELEYILNEHDEVTTYKHAVAVLEDKRNDPANQIICDTCGWTAGMSCPECASGCGCNNLTCSGWRHQEYWTAEEESDFYECGECGADSRNHYDCQCAEACTECGGRGGYDCACAA